MAGKGAFSVRNVGNEDRPVYSVVRAFEDGEIIHFPGSKTFKSIKGVRQDMLDRELRFREHQ
jgi:hypothetical protein